jgi:hypothetical protein
MRALSLTLVLAVTIVSGVLAADAEWRAGVGRREITPRESIWMGGYGARDHPSEGVLQPLWAKALVLQDRKGTRVALVGIDLIGIDRRLADAVCQRVLPTTGIPRERIVLNCSHTHSGPVVAGVTPLVYDLTPQQQEVVAAYARDLESELAAAIEMAVKDLRPATLAFGEGKATFGANRRAMRVKPKPGDPPPPAPVDHGVPVLAVRGEDGSLRAAMFGYACHSTTLGIYQINADYPGFAQAAIEASHPGATALFLAGCGGDVNPHPRSEIELAQQHGKSLATAVDDVLRQPQANLHGPLQVGFERVELKLVAAPGKEQLERLLQDKNVYQQRLAKYLLAELAAGRTLPTSYPCPVQVLRFGDDLIFAALGGETCVDYALRLRREFAGRRIWIAGFSNEIFSYVPTERILQEGGYEGGAAMVYFGFHGPYQPGLENLLINAVHRLAEKR